MFRYISRYRKVGKPTVRSNRKCKSEVNEIVFQIFPPFSSLVGFSLVRHRRSPSSVPASTSLAAHLHRLAPNERLSPRHNIINTSALVEAAFTRPATIRTVSYRPPLNLVSLMGKMVLYFFYYASRTQILHFGRSAVAVRNFTHSQRRVSRGSKWGKLIYTKVTLILS